MYKFGTTKRFDKALKLCRKRGYPIEELRKAIAILVENGSLHQNTNHIFFMVTMKVNGRRI
jgi:mRNA-degrading endonuclease YafQ of YafQ-DinJ toxin-antitoxin module